MRSPDMSARSFLDKIKMNEILPVAIGAVGVVYYALQANAPVPSSDSPKQVGEWTKHVQTGQLFAVAALATGVLVARFGGKKNSG
jgi:hypothetical protein